MLSLLHIIKKIVHTRGFRPREWRYLWNTQNQLTACFTPKGDCWHYTYDAFGRRLSKTKTVDSDLAHIDPLFPQIKPKITTWRYLWSGDQLIEETPIYADGTLAVSQQIQWLYQPGEITPTARYQQGKLHYVVTDHQGTPREIFSEGGQASWAGRLNTWGQMQFWRYREGKAENDPNYTECPFRFAGQYEDEESGLYYNRFRYYDRETGQYLSPDPIGLLGGFNPYGYVHCPTGYIDPFGLCGTSKLNNASVENNPRFLVDVKGQVLDLEYFRNLKFDGQVIDAGRSGNKLPAMSTPNTYLKTTGGHVIVYGPDGRRLADVSQNRIKITKWNENPKTGELFPHSGSETKFADRDVPYEIRKLLGLE
ncbi:RHS repeat domain-containing protein [Proteus mirabilis]|uniref:RHS repeat domain-containing protein n=2 Tax=Proteus TaxID=583 RepID=UPI0039B5F5E9